MRINHLKEKNPIEFGVNRTLLGNYFSDVCEIARLRNYVFGSYGSNLTCGFDISGQVRMRLRWIQLP